MPDNLLPITRTDIDTCASERVLRLWHTRYYEEQDRLVSEAEASDLLAYDNQDWRKMMRDKIARCIMAMKQIEGRALELGFAPILTRRTRQRAVIHEQAAEIERLRAELAARDMGRAA